LPTQQRIQRFPANISFGIYGPMATTRFLLTL